MNGGHLAGKRLADPTSPEYDSFTPMLNSSVPENEHLDTKVSEIIPKIPIKISAKHLNIP